MSTAREKTAYIIGLAAGSLAAVAWILFVQHLVATASAGGSRAYWANEARHRAYDVCFDGCDDCLDVSVIHDACRMTAAAAPPSSLPPHVSCDARLLWTWADRYPDECLDAVGALYRDQAVRRRRFWLRFLYVLVPLAVVVAGAAAAVALPLLEWGSRRWPAARPRVRAAGPGSSSASTPLLRGAVAVAAVVSVLLVGPAAGFPCDEFHPAYNQPFVSTRDASLFGNVHGWLSDCYTEEYSCGEKCRSDHTTTTSCTTDWCSRSYEMQSPRDFVRAAMRRVGDCGFKPVDIVPGVTDRRIANSRIESMLLVKITVNRLNATDAVEPQVMCLYEMLGVPSYDARKATTRAGQGTWWATLF